MEKKKPSNLIKISLIVGGTLVVIAGVLYFGQAAKDASPTLPSTGIYYKGRMAADIESENHDPRRKGHTNLQSKAAGK